MKINKIEVLSKKGNPYFVYKYEDGKFASKALFEEQESKTKPSNKKKKKKKKVTADEQEVIMNDNFPKIEERIADLDKTEEWIGESGTYAKEVMELELSIENLIQEEGKKEPVLEDVVSKKPGLWQSILNWFN